MDTFAYKLIMHILLLFVVKGMYMFIQMFQFLFHFFFYQNFVIFMSLSKGDRKVSVSHVYLKFSVV